MKTLFVLVLTLAAWLSAGTAAAQIRATILPESRLVIEGRSTVNRFECEAGTIEGAGVFVDGQADVRVDVPVGSFDCGKERMNRDFKEAMEADEHPEVSFELTDARRADRLDDGRNRLVVQGRLTIAGVTRDVELETDAELLPDGRYRVRGAEELKMSDFGIDPPTALAGLIRARDRIVVRFDLRASTMETGSPSAHPLAGTAVGTLHSNPRSGSTP